ASAADPDPLARARTLYNQRQFEAAVAAANQARLIPARADSADLIAARAYLERFRESAATDDLTSARERLRGVDPQRFGPRERVLAELSGRPTSAAAVYWLSAAAHGQGDLQGAWNAAQAGWVRAALAADRGVRLRADLERLVLRALIPERARALGQSPDAVR